MSEPIAIRVLGRVEIGDPERDRTLGRGRARELLALLVASRDTPLPTTEIVDAIWPDEAPATAPTIVHGLIRHLRTTLGSGSVVSEPAGYRLDLPAGAVDLWILADAARSGDHRRVRSGWREPAFGTYADRHWARRALAQLPHIQGLTDDSARHRPSRSTAPVSRLIGRRRELAAIAAALERSRLVTIVGLGGVGKSRLALEIATATASSARVDVGTSVGPVISRITADLGLAASGEADWDLRTTTSSLGGRDLLLLIDGCEHDPSGSADAIEKLLASCPRLRILATSRVALGARGEQIVPLLPFDSPADPQGDAVALLLDRAVALGLPADRNDRRRLGALCARTAGVPLAIELAVADAVFTTGSDDAPVELPTERRTPAEAVGSLVHHALDGLTPGAATAIHRAARLINGFTPALLAELRESDTSAPGILHELRATGLTSEVADRSRRFRLLDPVRLVLLDRPDDGALTAVTGAVHRVLTALRPTLEEPTVLPALEDAVAELPNTEALLTGLVRVDRHDDALRLVRAGVDAWSESGAWSRGGALIESILSLVRPDPAPASDEGATGHDPRHRAPVDALSWAGAVWARSFVRATYATTFADYARAQVAATIAADAADHALEAHLRFMLVIGSGYGGDLAAATDHRRRLHHLVETLDSDYGRAMVAQVDALARLVAGDPADAATGLRAAATRAEAMGAIADAARIHRLEGLARRAANDPTGALDCLHHAEALAVEARAHGSLATIRTDLVDIRHRSGHVDRRVVVEALDTVLGVGNLRAAGLLRVHLGLLDRDATMLADAVLDLLESDRVWASVALVELHDQLPRRHPLRRLAPTAAAALRMEWGSPLGAAEAERVDRLCADLTTGDHRWSEENEDRLRGLLREISTMEQVA